MVGGGFRTSVAGPSREAEDQGEPSKCSDIQTAKVGREEDAERWRVPSA